jgi:leader peptidase (prepilin peptidase)/N-methyltransferase
MIPPPVASGVQAALFIALLTLASAIDIRARIIPDRLCVFIALTGLICFRPARLLGILAALPLLIAALRCAGGIGGGDIKLTAASGLVLGFKGGIAGLIIGLAALLLFYALSRAVRRPPQKDTAPKKIEAAALPMAPFLAAGFTAAYALTIIGR